MVDPKTGRIITPGPWIDFFNAMGFDTETSIGSVISGVNQAKAAAAAAQGTANGAVAGVGNLAGQTLPFSGTVAPYGGAYSEVVAPVPPGGAVTNAVTVTPVGGTGPYTYSWFIPGSDIAITSPLAATTSFSNVNTLGVFDNLNQSAVCTITDFTAATTEVVCPVTIYGYPPTGEITP